jgi:hypothetical protein
MVEMMPLLDIWDLASRSIGLYTVGIYAPNFSSGCKI